MAQQLFDINGNEVFPRARPAGIGFANIIAIGAIIVMVAIMIATFLGYSPRPQAAQEAPRATMTPVVPAQPVAAPMAAPIIVQSVPAGQAPQPITIQQPAPAVDTSGGEVPPAPAPIVIVHSVSEDGAHQVITGSGACKVARVAARCGK